MNSLKLLKIIKHGNDAFISVIINNNFPMLLYIRVSLTTQDRSKVINPNGQK